ncbi:hypothetical protein [Cellulophaga sp. Z1A5H]|uniref:hypothetical protein n=1 Tax=Cellulophaga sp. Z1A5H TaxID=2687291 RepID=UPI0013FD4B89|nr:hypothetical protein [Cellulophaga sp. Z1A5H]
MKFLLKKYWIIAVLLILSSCDSDDKVYLTCDIFEQLEPKISEDENGVFVNIIFDAEILLNDIESYGFTYNIVGEREKTTIEGANLSSSTLNLLINDIFICGLEYEISGFITLGDSICTSSKTTFSTEKSYVAPPWCTTVFDIATRGSNFINGLSINGKSFILTEYLYEITNQPSLIQRESFPLNSNTGTNYASFSIGKFAYIKSTDTKDLYRYNSEENNWINLRSTGLPSFTRYFFGGQLNETGYLFNHINSYQYDLENNTFVELASYQIPLIINKFQTNSAIYVINEDYEILEFNKSNGTWSYLTTYPGNKSNYVISFVSNNKAYIGLSYNYFSPGINYSDIYELDLNTATWQKVVPFPTKLENSWTIGSAGNLDFGYMFYSKNGKTVLWNFDYSKIVYE